MLSAVSVCLFVCQHNNIRTIKRRMMKLGGYVHCTKISPEFDGGPGPHPWVSTPQNVVVCSVTMQTINKRMWAWQAWQWATPPHLSVNK